jgi:hypothetical protein
VVQYTVPPGACGCDAACSLPMGEQPQGAYTLSTSETLV